MGFVERLVGGICSCHLHGNSGLRATRTSRVAQRVIEWGPVMCSSNAKPDWGFWIFLVFALIVMGVAFYDLVT